MNSRITWSQLLEHVMENGLPDRETAEDAVRVTMHLLGQRLTDDEALALEAVFSPALERLVDESEYDRALDGPALYTRATEAMGRTPGEAHEAVDIVLQTLGALLPPELRLRLQHALPQELDDLLTPPVRGEPAEYPPRGRGVPSTLASGHPGSRHSIAESPEAVAEIVSRPRP